MPLHSYANVILTSRGGLILDSFPGAPHWHISCLGTLPLHATPVRLLPFVISCLHWSES